MDKCVAETKRWTTDNNLVDIFKGSTIYIGNASVEATSKTPNLSMTFDRLISMQPRVDSISCSSPYQM